MAPSNVAHRRTHNLLLITKLLNQKEQASPVTLVLDTLEQSAKPLIQECIKRAKRHDTKVIFVSFETLRKPYGVDYFIPTWSLPPQNLHKSLLADIRSASTGQNQKLLLIIDSFPLLALSLPPSLPFSTFLSSLLFSPTSSLFGIYHLDVPLSRPQLPHQPSLLQTLQYLSTSIISVHNFSHVLRRREDVRKGHVQTQFGLERDIEGVLVGEEAQLTSQTDDERRGIVLELEFRRKSGRGLVEWYFLPLPLRIQKGVGGNVQMKGGEKETVVLLDDHPLWRVESSNVAGDGDGGEGDEMNTTFSLGLTERQKRDREGVVLPYFDAQKGLGGEGGRILYDMGVEDDFDDEEDEI